MIRCEVLLMPTLEKHKGSIVMKKSQYKRLYIAQSNYPDLDGWCEAQHLYIISPQMKIANGDWYIGSVGDDEGNHIEYIRRYDSSDIEALFSPLGKIVATTDKSLKTQVGTEDISGMPIYEYLPEPSPEFINDYIHHWNGQWTGKKKITSVLVDGSEEYTSDIQEEGSDYIPEILINVNKKNQISIKLLKENWGREEFLLRLQEYGNYVCNKVIHSGKPHYMSASEWLDKFYN